MTVKKSSNLRRALFVAALVLFSILAVISYLKLSPWHGWLVSRTSIEVAVIYFYIAGLVAFILPFLSAKYLYWPLLIGALLLMSFWGVASDRVPGVSAVAGPILFVWLLFGDVFLTTIKK